MMVGGQRMVTRVVVEVMWSCISLVLNHTVYRMLQHACALHGMFVL